jgi:ABC-2 type transport system ATP-binding protein
MAAIEVEGLSKYWNQTKAVDGISFQVNKGEVFGFLGPNGAGKTTTIKMLVGLTKPTNGDARVAGYDVVDDIRSVKQHIGVVPELSNLYDELTVTQNLRFVSKLYHVPAHRREEIIQKLLDLFQLTEYADKGFAKLSKGLKRRVVLAAALVHGPEILFLDEPTSGLDIMSARRLREIISDLSKHGVTIFLTTHYIEEADLLCDRIALLVKGKIIKIDTPEGLKNSVQDVPILKVRFNGEFDNAFLDRIQGESVSLSGGELSILSKDIHASLESLFRVAEEQNISLQNIETVKPTLEDAFIQLTGVSLDSMRVEKEGKR